MNIFKSYTFNWWQIGLFKLALLAIGILIGSYWSEFWGDLTWGLVVIAIATGVYVAYIALKQ